MDFTFQYFIDSERWDEWSGLFLVQIHVNYFRFTEFETLAMGVFRDAWNNIYLLFSISQLIDRLRTQFGIF